MAARARARARAHGLTGSRVQAKTSVMVQQKSLELVQSWADAFRGDTALVAVAEAYGSLLQDGAEFPPQDMVPTPHRVRCRVGLRATP